MAIQRLHRRGGVAMGISAVLFLGFISLVFMFSRPLQVIDHTIHPADNFLNRNSETTQKQKIVYVGSPSKLVDATQSEIAKKDTQVVEPVATNASIARDNVTSISPSPIATTSGNKSVEKGQEVKASPEAGEADTAKLSELDVKYKPTQKMVSNVAQNGYLVVTWANHHYNDFVRTWIAHVRSVNVTGFLVGAMDDELLQSLIETVPRNCFSMRSGLTLGDFGWGSPTFAKMGREKIRLIRTFLGFNVNVVIADVDVLFLRNPLPFFEKYPTADILTSSDHLAATVQGEQLERFQEAGSAANIGIMLFRSKSAAFVEEWIQVIEADEKIWDQNAFNDLFRRKIRIPPAGSALASQNLFYGYNGSLVIGILPVSLFCSGHTLYTQHLARRMGLEPYAVHATFQFSGTPGKRHRMREEGWWEDAKEYYRPPGGVVSFEMDGLSSLLRPSQRPVAEPIKGVTLDPAFAAVVGRTTNATTPALLKELQNVDGHFRLVNHQLLRIRTGFSLASMLDRSLVVPQLACFADRWWAPHNGIIPGSNMVTPFTCPLDHVLDLEGGIFGNHDVKTFGKPISIREHSFLSNPRLPDDILSDMILVEVCPRDLTPEELRRLGCSDGSEPAKILDPNALIDGNGDGAGGESGDSESSTENPALHALSQRIEEEATASNGGNGGVNAAAHDKVLKEAAGDSSVRTATDAANAVVDATGPAAGAASTPLTSPTGATSSDGTADAAGISKAVTSDTLLNAAASSIVGGADDLSVSNAASDKASEVAVGAKSAEVRRRRMLMDFKSGYGSEIAGSAEDLDPRSGLRREVAVSRRGVVGGRRSLLTATEAASVVPSDVASGTGAVTSRAEGAQQGSGENAAGGDAVLTTEGGKTIGENRVDQVVDQREAATSVVDLTTKTTKEALKGKATKDVAVETAETSTKEKDAEVKAEMKIKVKTVEAAVEGPAATEAVTKKAVAVEAAVEESVATKVAAFEAAIKEPVATKAAAVEAAIKEPVATKVAAVEVEVARTMTTETNVRVAEVEVVTEERAGTQTATSTTAAETSAVTTEDATSSSAKGASAAATASSSNPMDAAIAEKTLGNASSPSSSTATPASSTGGNASTPTDSSNGNEATSTKTTSTATATVRTTTTAASTDDASAIATTVVTSATTSMNNESSTTATPTSVASSSSSSSSATSVTSSSSSISVGGAPLEALAATSEDDSEAQEVLNAIAQPIAASAFRGVVRISSDLDSARLLVALSSVRSAKVLHFRTLVGAVRDFGLGLTHTPEARNQFERRMQLYGSIWCCVHNHPGHVHYDLLWDVPHLDRHGRVWSAMNPWVQIPGP